MADDRPFNLAQSLNRLKPKDKLPRSASVLNTWITQAEKTLSSDGGRLGWLIASTVVAAALQQAVDDQGRPSFLLKGGTLLQHRLPGSRTTTDVDSLVRRGYRYLLGGARHGVASSLGAVDLQERTY